MIVVSKDTLYDFYSRIDTNKIEVSCMTTTKKDNTGIDKLISSVKTKVNNKNFSGNIQVIAKTFATLKEENDAALKAGKAIRGLGAKECGIIANANLQLTRITRTKAVETRDLDTAKVAAYFKSKSNYWFSKRQEKIDWAKTHEEEYKPAMLSKEVEENLLEAYLTQSA